MAVAGHALRHLQEPTHEQSRQPGPDQGSPASATELDPREAIEGSEDDDVGRVLEGKGRQLHRRCELTALWVETKADLGEKVEEAQQAEGDVGPALATEGEHHQHDG